MDEQEPTAEIHLVPRQGVGGSLSLAVCRGPLQRGRFIDGLTKTQEIRIRAFGGLLKKVECKQALKLIQRLLGEPFLVNIYKRTRANKAPSAAILVRLKLACETKDLFRATCPI